MEDYYKYFVFDESFIKKYSPYPSRFFFDSPWEFIQPYNGPFKKREDYVHYLEALKGLLTENEISLELHFTPLIYFATLISQYAHELSEELGTDEWFSKRDKFLDDLTQLPLDFTAQGGNVIINERIDEWASFETYKRSTEIDNKDADLRERAAFANFYYRRADGSKLVKPNHRELEISRQIEVKITSKVKKRYKVIVPDIQLVEKIVSVIVSTICRDKRDHQKTIKKAYRAVNKVLYRQVVNFVGLAMLKYINDFGLLKQNKQGKPSNDQCKFLFDYFALLDWIIPKKGYGDLLTHKYSSIENPISRKCKVYRLQYKTRANYIRDILNHKYL